MPSTIDPDDVAAVNRTVNRTHKRPVRISAWRLAKLNRDEAMRAGAKARESSSVLRPVGARGVIDADNYSSGNASSRSSMSLDFSAKREIRPKRTQSPLKCSYPPSQASRDDIETVTQSRSSFSSPGHMNESATLSPLSLEHRYGPSGGRRLTAPGNQMHIEHFPSMSTNMLNTRGTLPIFNSARDVYGTSSHDCVDDGIIQNNMTTGRESTSQLTRIARANHRSSVFWDQAAGRYVSFPVPGRNEHVVETGTEFLQGQQSVGMSTSPFSCSGQLTQEGDNEKISPASNLHELQSPRPAAHPENLLYSGESIFFGGPLSVPFVESNKKEKSLDMI